MSVFRTLKLLTGVDITISISSTRKKSQTRARYHTIRTTQSRDFVRGVAEDNSKMPPVTCVKFLETMKMENNRFIFTEKHQIFLCGETLPPQTAPQYGKDYTDTPSIPHFVAFVCAPPLHFSFSTLILLVGSF